MDSRYYAIIMINLLGEIEVSSKGKRQKAGFSMIEVLIVISMVAVLSVVVLVVLNPVQFLKQSRDAVRMSDLATINKAMAIYQTEVGTPSSGSQRVVYVSIPDPTATTTAGTDCSGIGLPAGGGYHCAASSTFRKTDGTGWLPIDLTEIAAGSPITSWPIDKTNTTSSNLYYSYATDGTAWEVWATPEADKYQAASEMKNFRVGTNQATVGGSLAGWVPVPGNPVFGTNNFWVMKYEAKCVEYGSNTPSSTGANLYQNSSRACTGANKLYVSSASNGPPITSISHTTASQYCTAIGAHLLTNDEYMTIARDAESQGSNWSGGSVGSGFIYTGHSDSFPNNFLAASSDDNNGYVNTNNSAPGSQKRTLNLSNGGVIWDLSGNAWENVARSSNNVGDDTSNITAPACNSGTGIVFCEFAPGVPLADVVSTTNWGSVISSKVSPSNATWNSSNGVGAVYTYRQGGNFGTKAYLRGGNYFTANKAGLYNLHTLWNINNTDPQVGFRCAK